MLSTSLWAAISGSHDFDMPIVVSPDLMWEPVALRIDHNGKGHTEVASIIIKKREKLNEYWQSVLFAYSGKGYIN